MTVLDAAFERARPVADAVLREGQVLFPYRASALKNRHRWQWGVLVPERWRAATGSDASSAHVEVVVDVRRGARLHVRARFVQLRSRTVEVDDGGGWRAVPDVDVGDAVVASWDEAEERSVDLVDVALVPGRHEVPITVAGGAAVEPVARRAGGAARLVRERWPLEGRLAVDVEPVTGPWPLVRVRAAVANTSRWCDTDADRGTALRRSLVATHLVLAVEGASLVAPLDPPEFARSAVASCRHDGLWPSLVGSTDERDVVLAAPIVLPDHAAVADASAGDSCDATEIDELLARCVAGLTDDERREVRGTDEAAARILERFGGASTEVLGRLHATVQALDERPRAAVVVDGVVVEAGSRVLLRPGPGTDAQDRFVDGRTAVVEDVLHDAEGGVHLAVTVEDDPGVDVHRVRGRFRYFRTDEVDPL